MLLLLLLLLLKLLLLLLLLPSPLRVGCRALAVALLRLAPAIARLLRRAW